MHTYYLLVFPKSVNGGMIASKTWKIWNLQNDSQVFFNLDIYKAIVSNCQSDIRMYDICL